MLLIYTTFFIVIHRASNIKRPNCKKTKFNDFFVNVNSSERGRQKMSTTQLWVPIETGKEQYNEQGEEGSFTAGKGDTQSLLLLLVESHLLQLG